MTASRSAYRIRMSSAFVVDPDKPMDIPKLAAEEGRKAAFEGIKQAVIKGADTLMPQAGAARHHRSVLPGAGA